jgi:hypothetical protein
LEVRILLPIPFATQELVDVKDFLGINDLEILKVCFTSLSRVRDSSGILYGMKWNKDRANNLTTLQRKWGYLKFHRKVRFTIINRTFSLVFSTFQFSFREKSANFFFVKFTHACFGISSDKHSL